MTYHSNLPPASITAVLAYRDPYAQHSYDEYQGSVVCCRQAGVITTDQIKMCAEEICKFSVSLPKEVLIES